MQDKHCLHLKIEETSFNISAIPTKQIPMNHFAKESIPGVVIVSSEFLCSIIPCKHYLSLSLFKRAVQRTSKPPFSPIKKLAILAIFVKIANVSKHFKGKPKVLDS